MTQQHSRLAATGMSKRAKTVLKAVGALLGVTLVALAALMLTFRAATLDLPAVSVGDLPPAAPPAEMSISRLPTGTYETPAAMAFRGGAFDDVRQFAATAVLVRHPKGNLLIDTGFGKRVDDHMKLLPSIQRSPHHKRAAAVDQLAVTPGPITLAGIIPTHAHWDHISGIEDLPGVPVLATEAAQSWIKSGAKGTEVLNSIRNLTYRGYDFAGGPYLGFAKSHDIWGDGSVVIVPAPGHTPDSVVVFVNLPSGRRYAFIGDLAWQLEGIDIPAEKPWMLRWMIGEDSAHVHRDIALIRAARAKFPQIRPVPAHDRAAFETIPVFPASAR
jgi:N-acyl homoserine lactone hydrolase